MENNRLTKLVFNYDYHTSGKTWCSEIKSIFAQVNLLHKYTNKDVVDLKVLENALSLAYQREWVEKIYTVPKLRTYVTFKTTYESEKYIKMSITKQGKISFSAVQMRNFTSQN